MMEQSPISPHSTNDHAHGAMRNTEVSGRLNIADATSDHGSDGGNIIITEFSDHQRSFGLSGMQIVSQPRYPFQIGNGVIGLDEINVVDLRKVAGIWNECKGNDAMDGPAFDEAVCLQKDAGVSAMIDKGPQHFRFDTPKTSILATTEAVNTSNPSEVTGLVPVPKFGDANGSPFFSDCGIHSVGRPSGNNGAAVKNPSRAQTLGGFAISSIPLRAVQEKQGGTQCR